MIVKNVYNYISSNLRKFLEAEKGSKCNQWRTIPKPDLDTKRKAYPKAMPHLRGKRQHDCVPPGNRPRSLGASADGRPREAVDVRGTC
ncbi:hypothetical protein DPMN_105242 [Dreissena polymorpha]|uniref:Uncharacterized protein n=1 Tax=Dreissena polymorpha TaxID=45954 RepID=A0A9D4HB91_DREPO|nr:hypothetical protein DPMN_105242 [Dreissena polymorpha]